MESLPKHTSKASLLAQISPHFTELSGSGRQELRDLLIHTFYGDEQLAHCGTTSEQYLQTDAGQQDIENHLTGRLAEFRATCILWLASVVGLRGNRVLEIGCGTGSSTVALLEQGAHVLAVDVEEQSLPIAELRCRLHGVNDVRFLAANAADLDRVTEQRFDIVVFFAALEHMTYAERISALRAAWGLLEVNGYLCIIETPNRLWYFDPHTTLTNFFHWLPDPVACAYSRFVPRKGFRESLGDGELDAETAIRLARWGRGVSYHEIEIAIRPLEELPDIYDMSAFLREVDEERALQWAESFERDYERLLTRIEPRVNAAFYQAWLNVLVKKPA